jgi:predicted DNA-binding protein (MmcQ/YjbR family)
MSFASPGIVPIKPADLRGSLIGYALDRPDAYEDHPWGEIVAKVGKKVFVFFGVADGDGAGMSVKLPASQPLALAQPGVSSTGYGLGKAGWVTVRFAEADLPLETLREWIDESYRAVAPKRQARPPG